MAQCDAVVDFCSEMAEGNITALQNSFTNSNQKNTFLIHISASVPCAPWVPDGEDKAKSLEAFKAKLDKFIPNIEKILEENGGEWMVGDGFTWADLYVAYVLDQVKHGGVSRQEDGRHCHFCSVSEGQPENLDTFSSHFFSWFIAKGPPIVNRLQWKTTRKIQVFKLVF